MLFLAIDITILHDIAFRENLSASSISNYDCILSPSFIPHPSERNAINTVQFSDKSTEDFPVICYTDGSKIDGRVGFAFVVFRSGVESENFQFRIRDERTVFVAELLCLNFAVKWITEQNSVISEYLICTDSLSSLDSLKKIYTRAFGDGPRNFEPLTWTTPDGLLTTTPHQREDVSALDRFNVHLCPTRRVFSGTGLEPVTKQATVRYLYHSATAATLFDGENKRYEVPAQKDFPLLQAEKHMDPNSMKYIVNVTDKSNIFSFKIIRKEDNSVIWDTSIGGLVLSDKFLQISSYLPSRNIYGLGEHTHETLRHDLDYKTWPMFARDRFPEGGQINLYGVHPYYTCLENSSNSHGVLLLNSNAMGNRNQCFSY
ncbi:sucrase-isomaltase, intestinal [Trichonephila clavipes]|nr:sucrase-isomaltase, intestinal [Trichonephila clavipes]